MPRSTLFDRVCAPKAVMSCHARRFFTVRAVQGRRCHAKSDVIRPCVLSKGGDVMPHPMSSDSLCRPRAAISCHADVVRPCVMPNGDDGMPHPTSFDRVCYPKAMIACHARRCSIVCAVQDR